MSGSAHENRMVTLRNHLFSGEEVDVDGPDAEARLRQLITETESSHTAFSAWKRLRGLGVVPDNAEAAEVFGVVGEIGGVGGAVLIFGLKDGSVSLYNPITGGGIIGGSGNERVRNACRRLIEQARPFAAQLPVVDDFSYPEPGRYRFSLLTTRGVQAVTIQEGDVSDENHELAPLCFAWNALVTQLRLTDPREHRAASSRSAARYANLLLCMMGDQSVGPVKLVARQRVPELESVAMTGEHRQMLREIELPFDEIDSSAVMSLLKRLGGFRWYRPFKRKGAFVAKRVLSSEKTVDVGFEIQATKDELRRQNLLVRCR